MLRGGKFIHTYFCVLPRDYYATTREPQTRILVVRARRDTSRRWCRQSRREGEGVSRVGDGPAFSTSSLCADFHPRCVGAVDVLHTCLEPTFQRRCCHSTPLHGHRFTCHRFSLRRVGVCHVEVAVNRREAVAYLAAVPGVQVFPRPILSGLGTRDLGARARRCHPVRNYRGVLILSSARGGPLFLAVRGQLAADGN